MAAPTITPAIAGLMALSTAASVGGSVIAGKESAAAARDAAKEAAKGPIRGGTDRAGNQAEMEGFKFDPSAMEKLGANSIQQQNPVYGGSSGGSNPIDLNSLFKPQSFGQGYSVGQPQQPKFNNGFKGF